MTSIKTPTSLSGTTLKEIRKDLELLVRMEQIKRAMNSPDFPEFMVNDDSSEEDLKNCIVIRKLKTLYYELSR